MKQCKCPCCGNYTIRDYNDICRVCFWECEDFHVEDLNQVSGANGISLLCAKENYRNYGVCDLRFSTKVRKPLPEELPENNE